MVRRGRLPAQGYRRSRVLRDAGRVTPLGRTVGHVPDVTRRTRLPADLLWEVLSDVRGWATWLPTVEEVAPLEPSRPDEVGASYRIEQAGLPSAVWTITEITPGRGFTWQSREPGLVSTGTHELVEEEDGASSIVLGIRWTGPLATPVGWAYGRRTKAMIAREAEALEATAAGRGEGP